LTLPALDLPVSRTGVELYHSPRYRIDLEPGTFRLESDPGVFAEALRVSRDGAAYGPGYGFGTGGLAKSAPPPAAPMAPPLPSPAPTPPPFAASARPDAPQDNMKQLIDRYRNEGGGRTVRGALPVEVTFPTMGPSMFMAAELTAEAQAPAIDLAIRRTNK